MLSSGQKILERLLLQMLTFDIYKLNLVKTYHFLYQEKTNFVNIQEKLPEDKSNLPQSKNIKKMSEEDKRELRRKQQERALAVQDKINKELENSNESESCEEQDTIGLQSGPNKSANKK